MLPLLLLACAPSPDPLDSAGEVPAPRSRAEWLAELNTRLEAASYGFAVGEAGDWQGASPPQGLLLHADADGVRVDSRGTTFRMDLTAWGADGQLETVPAATWGLGACARAGGVDPTGACVRSLEAVRGGVLERWESGPEGLEQTFEVAAPTGPGDLVLDVAVTGAEVDVEHDAARLRLEGGQVLRYSGLRAWDATGRELTAHLEPQAEGVRLRVDVRTAAFPVTVDPVISGYWLVGGESTSDYFGYSVDGAGDVNGDGYDDVVVGAYTAGTSGTVYVYYGSNTGPSLDPDWTETSRFAGSRFGFSVAGAGDVNGDGYADVLIGAPYAANPTSNEGMAFLYTGSASGLGSSSAWSVEGNQSSAYCGYGVAAAGDVNGDGFDDILVSLPYYDDGSTDEGAVWLFFGGGTGPSASADWVGEGDQGSAYYGLALAGAGDVNGDGYKDVLVGAPRYEDGQTDEGAAFLYFGSSSGPSASPDWDFQANQASAYVGAGVTGAGDTNGDGFDDIFVGANYYDSGSTNEGYVWGFLGTGAGPSTSSSWYMEGNRSSAYLGSALSGAGDVNGDGYADLVVGTASGSSNAGAYYIFNGSSAGVSELADYEFESGFSSAYLGQSVAGAGDTDGDGYDDVVIGGSTWDSNTGLALMQYGSADGIQRETAFEWEGLSSGYTLGAEVTDAGDLDGDGFGDVAVYADSTGTSDYVYVYLGTSAGLPSSADISLSGTASAAYGLEIDGGADVNADGYDDLLVTASSATSAYTSEGSVWVYYGSSTGVSASSYTRLDGGQAYAYFGYSAAFVGDVDADGYDDLLVGAYAYDDGSTNEGEVFLYRGGASGISSAQAWSLDSDQASAQFGFYVDGAGDVDADGYDDLLIGASYYDEGQTNEGGIFLVYGGVSGPDPTWAWHTGGDQADAQCALAVGVGDANGDGYDDIARGCHLYDGVGTSSGRVDFWYGSASGPASTADWSYEATAAGDTVGSSVAPAGDLNEDGYDDMVMGAPGVDYALDDQGEVDVFYGSATGYDAEPNATFIEYDESAGLGCSVSGTADVDGDGVGEVIAGACGLGQVLLYEIPDVDGDGSVTWDDCDDTDAARYPGAFEFCDGVDNDCDGDVDEEVSTWYDDDDGDGYGDAATAVVQCAAPSGAVTDATDCDDTDAAVSPLATESCNGVDDDCDSAIDEEGASGSTTYYADSDGDGFGDPDSTAQLCAGTIEWITDYTDCDDAHDRVHPGGIEYCNDADDDCDGDTDEYAVDATTWYTDNDGDGFGVAGTGQDACDAPAWTIDNDLDCDDLDAAISPDALEVCDGDDDDCDGTIDNGVSFTYYADSDGDGYGDPAASTTACALSAGYVTDATDCDDTTSDVSPVATEDCDSVDDDCDGEVDEGAASTWYADSDGDGFGDASVTTAACTAPDGYVAFATDCDDGDAAISPADVEVCNDVDDDCDGTADDGLATTPWYLDADGDGFGSPAGSVSDCTRPDGYVDNAGDCDDADGSVGAAGAWYADTDEDGYGDPATATAVSCSGPEGYIQEGTDCDDAEAGVNPGEKEAWYDGVDQDCDGNDDDQDEDGASQDEDCDDTDPDVISCDSSPGETAETGGGSGDDTGDTGDVKTPDDCGCASTGSAGAGAFGLALVVLALRRRQ